MTCLIEIRVKLIDVMQFNCDILASINILSYTYDYNSRVLIFELLTAICDMIFPSYVNTIHEIHNHSISNEGLDVLNPLNVRGVSLQVISPILFVIKLADITVCEAAL